MAENNVNIFDRDITELHNAQKEVEYLNRKLQLLREIKHLIIHEKESLPLLQKTCDTLTNAFRLQAALVIIPGTNGANFELVQSGFSTAEASQLSAALADGGLPTCCQTKHGDVKKVVSATHCGLCPPEKRRRDVAILTSPLQHEEAHFGFLSVHLPAKVGVGACFVDVFPDLDLGREEKLSLIDEIAGDVAFALHAIQIEAARKASEAHFQLLTDNTFDVIWAMGLDLVFTYVNSAIEKQTGYSPEEWIGTHLRDHCSEANYHELLKVIEREIAKGKEHSGVILETEIFRKGGSLLAVEVHGTVVYDEAGNPVGLQGTNRDITERRKAEQELRQSEEKHRTLFETMAQGAVYQEADGTIFSINPAAERILGLTLEEVQNRISNDVRWQTVRQDGSVFPVCEHPAMVALRTGKRVSDVIMGIWNPRENQRRWISIDAVPQFKAGDKKPYQVYTTFDDITELRNAEEERSELEAQLRQSQKMESIGRLAGGVAHDFNNMLSVIHGNAEIVLEELESSNPIHRDIEEILEASRRSANLTRQLLAFARKQTIAPEVLDLNEVIAGMLKMLRRLIGEHINFSWKPHVELPLVDVDPGQVDQILANLIVNARDAIDGVGSVKIETGKAKLDENECRHHPGIAPGEYVYLEVTDTGSGMDKETLSHIFEPFFSTKTIGKGTGLGLPTVYGIARQNHGFVDVKSELGKGTTFRVYLPRHAEPEAVPEVNAADVQLRKGTETILLVEDEAPVLRLVQRLLKQLNYNVLAAQRPGEAVAIVRDSSEPINVLLTDVVMPEMNGRELFDEIAGLRPTMKCVFMSGYTADAIAKHGILESGISFLEKPFTKQDLAVKLQETLD